MGFLHPNRDIPRARSGLKAQGYPAVVVKNDDSKHADGKKRQRVQVRVPQLHRNIPDDQLPWSMPQHGGGSANAGSGVGNVNIPPENAKVFAHYDEEDPHMMYYTSSPSTDDVGKDHEAHNEDYPHTMMNVDHAGNKQSVNTKRKTITDTAVSGATMMRDKEGNFYLYAPGKLILGAKGGIDIASKGPLKMHAKGEMSVKGSKIGLNGSDKSIEPTEVGARQTPQIANRSKPDL